LLWESSYYFIHDRGYLVRNARVDDFAESSIVEDGLASWNLCLHQYTIGHGSKQFFLMIETAEGKGREGKGREGYFLY